MPVCVGGWVGIPSTHTHIPWSSLATNYWDQWTFAVYAEDTLNLQNQLKIKGKYIYYTLEVFLNSIV